MAFDSRRLAATTGWVIEAAAPPASERWPWLGRLGSLLGSVVCECGADCTAAIGLLADICERHPVGWLWSAAIGLVALVALIALVARLGRLNTGVRATTWDDLPDETTVVVFTAVE